MALIDIEYGSLASSDTMNKNFIYLDNKIAETSESIMTSISSIFSNIATINARLNDINENMQDSIKSLGATIEEYKAKTKILVNKASMLPDWKKCTQINFGPEASYTAKSNGYLLLVTVNTSRGNVFINNTSFLIKERTGIYDNASELISIPVSNGDVISTDVVFNSTYYLPCKEVSVADF